MLGNLARKPVTIFLIALYSFVVTWPCAWASRIKAASCLRVKYIWVNQGRPWPEPFYLRVNHPGLTLFSVGNTVLRDGNHTGLFFARGVLQNLDQMPNTLEKQFQVRVEEEGFLAYIVQSSFGRFPQAQHDDGFIFLV